MIDLPLSDYLKLLPNKIAVAISGGADSFALLHLTRDWARQNNTTLLALTVDHQLRAASASEARHVADWCQENGIAHQTLPWQGDKPTSALQATARNVRRHLLCAACVDNNITHLLLGHQADDQAETFFMRLQRGSGLTGLRAMQPVTRDKKSGVVLLRPLLSETRAALRDYCLTHQLPFIDDPSNDDRHFERVRMRQFLAPFPALTQGVTASATRLRRADDTLQTLAKNWLQQHLQTPAPEQHWLAREAWESLLPELQIRVLQILLRHQNLSQIETLQTQLAPDGFSGVTIAGFWIRPKMHNKQAGFMFQPEPQRNSGRPL